MTEPIIISGMRRHPTGEVRHIPTGGIGMGGMSTAGFLAALDEWLLAVVASARSGAFGDAVDWARSQSGGSADVAADYIELAAAIQEQAKEGTP